jgi:hypothetical protein
MLTDVKLIRTKHAAMTAYYFAETCGQAFPKKQAEIDTYVGSFLRHATNRPGGSKYTMRAAEVMFHNFLLKHFKNTKI